MIPRLRASRTAAVRSFTFSHRTEDDPGRPYRFKDAETLIDDFFDEVERVLRDRGIGVQVSGTESTQRSK
jgi:hypothetical protein